MKMNVANKSQIHKDLEYWLEQQPNVRSWGWTQDNTQYLITVEKNRFEVKKIELSDNQ